MRERGVDALFVGPSADLRYLLGYHALPLERLTLLVVPAEGDPALVVPELEAPRAVASGAADLIDVRTWTETEDPFRHVADVVRAAGVSNGAILAVQDRLWSAFTLQLQESIPAEGWVAGTTVMRELRIVKTADEIAALRRVGAAIDEVHRQVPGLLRPGRPESEVGRDIAELILREHDEVNFVIVASGPNGASPHHETGDRRLEEGDAVVVDIGGTGDGYCSDNTRNYVIGRAPEGYAELHEVLLTAQRAAVAAVRPGVAAEDVDRAARGIIEDAGYGAAFVHRTGHGIGVEEHEDPYIVAGNDEPLVEGMTFSVEPGIYLDGRYGARIEDIVAVTASGAERLNTVDRELTEVPVA
ncbi:MAG: Xaa-Pro peptidase family protein [Actinobacteria bacterium]|nr:Xaa-Pro peptidase family protein [Actinomycetota bacterium]